MLKPTQASSIAKLLAKIEWEGGIGSFISYEGANLDTSYDVPGDLRTAYAEAAEAVRRLEELLFHYEVHPLVDAAADNLAEGD